MQEDNPMDAPVTTSSSLLTKLRSRPFSGSILAIFLLVFALSVKMSYFRLHLFVLLPACWFLLSGPGLLPWAPKALRKIALLLPIPLAAAAVFFSAFWDNLIFSKGVFTFNKSEMIGTFMHLPLEEWFWFIDHTFFSAFFLMFLLKPEKPTPVTKVPSLLMNGLMGLCALSSLLGIWLINQDNSHYLFLGVNLGFMIPVLAIHWWVGLHILLANKRAWALSIIIPSAYLLGLDYWAMQVDIWYLSPDYITGIKIMDVYFEQILIYTLPSVIVAQATLILVRQFERIHNRRANGETLERQQIVEEIIARKL